MKERIPIPLVAETVKIGAMDFKIDTDKAGTGTDRRPPPNYSSRGVKLRLATLVALLGVTAVAMNEAGKPATWERLGFSSAAAKTQESMTPPHSHSIAPTDDNGSLNRFWSTQFGELEIAERKLLFKILDDRLGNSGFSGDTAKASRLIERLVREFKKNSSKNKFEESDIKEFSDLTYDISSWLKNNAGEKDDRYLETLQTQLNSLAYDLIEDRSALGRSAESLAWSRSRKRLAKPDPEGPTPVSIIQLTGQPNTYRGKRVEVAGTVKGVEKLKVANQELAFENYHVLWIKPREMSRTPYCVYVRTLPDNFPISNGDFLQVDEPVLIEGIFFKLRSYVTTTESIETCPLIVADSIVWNPQNQETEDSSWQPPMWLLTLCFVGIPILATWLATGVYRHTKVLPIKTGKQEQARISEELRSISNDPSVQSDRERIEQLQLRVQDEEE